MPSNYSLPSLTAHQTQPFFPGLTFLTRTKSIRQVRDVAYLIMTVELLRPLRSSF